MADRRLRREVLGLPKQGSLLLSVEWRYYQDPTRFAKLALVLGRKMGFLKGSLALAEEFAVQAVRYDNIDNP